jgi:hypothetical protein
MSKKNCYSKLNSHNAIVSFFSEGMKVLSLSAAADFPTSPSLLGEREKACGRHSYNSGNLLWKIIATLLHTTWWSYAVRAPSCVCLSC